MAYTTIDNPELYFQTKLYTGNGGTQSITLDGSENMQPDWTWIKSRGDTSNHRVYDSVRGATKVVYTNLTNVEGTDTNGLTSFDSDGFSLGTEGQSNGSGVNFASWNWLAGGTAPAITYTVKVVSDSGNKYRFDDFGTSAVTLDLQEGGTYTFDQSDSSNAGHPLRFSTTSNGTHGGGSEYTTGVTTNGTPGSSGAYTRITVAASAPQLYYYCSVHSLMGGSANTNSTFGSSNFSGSIQSTVSAGSTQGFSIVIWQGSGADAQIGHGLSSAPEMYVVKNRDDSADWRVGQTVAGNTMTGGNGYYMEWNDTKASTNPGSATTWGSTPTAPTSSVFTVGSNNAHNGSSDDMLAYCFHSVKGYSRISSYVGNGSTSGTFVYTGFRVRYVMIKRVSAGGNSWRLYDNLRDIDNEMDNALFITNAVEGNYDAIDFLSNGFKLRGTSAAINGSGSTYIFYAIAENPLVTSKGIPSNAK